MIYIIIGRDTNHNEWVMADTYENPDAAAKRCQELNNIQEGLAADDVYRVDTIEPRPGISNRQLYKMYANSIYGKAQGIVPGYTDQDRADIHKMLGEQTPVVIHDTDSMGGKADYNELLISQAGDFTTRDLFDVPPEETAGNLIICKECGCAVYSDESTRAIHVTWHNKLLP